jgi:hypothetical protein
MKEMMRYAMLGLMIVLAGCAGGPRVARLQIESNPEGAKIYEDNKLLGEAPIVKHYTFIEKESQIDTPTIKAVWPSGASADSYYQLKPSDDVIAVLERPKNAPNIAMDNEYAKKVHDAAAKQADISRGITQKELSLSSERCRAQQNGSSKAMVDDCTPASSQQ